MIERKLIYDIELNNQQLTLNSDNQNLLFMLLYELSDLTEHCFTYKQLKKDLCLTKKNYTNSRLDKRLETIRECLEGSVYVKSDGSKTKFNIIDMIKTDKGYNMKINKDFRYLFDVEKRYTTLNLDEFLILSTTSSKALYRYLSQFDKQCKINGGNLFYIMNVNKYGYKRRVDTLNETVDRLSFLFNDLTVKTIPSFNKENYIYHFKWKS